MLRSPRPSNLDIGASRHAHAVKAQTSVIATHSSNSIIKTSLSAGTHGIPSLRGVAGAHPQNTTAKRNISQVPHQTRTVSSIHSNSRPTPSNTTFQRVRTTTISHTHSQKPSHPLSTAPSITHVRPSIRAMLSASSALGTPTVVSTGPLRSSGRHSSRHGSAQTYAQQRQFSQDLRRQYSKEGDPGNIALSITDVTKKLDSGRILFNNLTTSFYHGAKIGILGKNGAGKSSLLKVLAGVDKNHDGVVEIAPGKVLGYLAQEPQLDEDKTVLENVLLGVQKQHGLLRRYDEIAEEFGNEDADIDALIDEQGRVQHQIDELDCWDLLRQVDMALEALCCPPKENRVSDLSGGQKRRVALAKLLLSKPDILLLDEPTNHLDSGSVQWLEQYLHQYEGLVMAITHDRYFLDNVAGYILEIENGRFFPFRGNYMQWLENKQKRQEQETSQLKNIDRNLERELQWMNSGTKGRQAKGKARERKLEELQAQKAEYRRNRIESGSLVIPQGPRLGGKVVQVQNLGLAYDNDAAEYNTVLTPEQVKEYEQSGRPVPWVFRNVNFTVEPGQVLGIVGPNGIGKTTILKSILGLIKPTVGEVHIGQSVEFGYNAQTREGLNPESTVWEEIAQGDDFVQVSPTDKIPARLYVANFNFSGPEQQKLIKHLSGGERNRVHLAKSLKRGTNVIMLDEPTNDLDVDTLRSLEEGVNSFEGCAFVVSHDRWFLDRVCTDILAFTYLPDPETGEAHMSAFTHQGNYSQFEKYFRDKTGREYVAQKASKFKSVATH